MCRLFLVVSEEIVVDKEKTDKDRATRKAYRDSNGSMMALVASLLNSESLLYRTTPSLAKESK